MSIDAMKQALEVLEEVQKFMKTSEWFDTRTDALRAAIEHAERPQTHSDDCWKWHHECAVAKIERLQEGAETLHAMYEQACQQRDQLMDQQSAQIAAMRGRMQ